VRPGRWRATAVEGGGGAAGGRAQGRGRGGGVRGETARTSGGGPPGSRTIEHDGAVEERSCRRGALSIEERADGMARRRSWTAAASGGMAVRKGDGGQRRRREGDRGE